MTYGYIGKILHVDLFSNKLSVEKPPEDFYRTYMGGSAMGLYYILHNTPPNIDPDAPENTLTFMVGVTTGATISGQSRLNVNAKSPLSGAIGDSQSGGFFPAELKFAGFDGIVVQGKSPAPVYLSIMDGECELKDASHLMGKVTGEVEDILKKEYGDPKIQILQCGLAAEKGVRFSSIISLACRNNGRTGLGLVMASKNLKAIVVRGHTPITVADKATVVALNRRGIKEMPDNLDMAPLAKYGTANVVLPQNTTGTLPTRNYNEGQFEDCEKISGERMYDTVLKERDTCFSCGVSCKRVVEISDGKYPVDPTYGGPEYETIGTLGSYCGVSDLAAVCYANQLCNMYGVDTISCGATVAFAMECFEKGIISLEQTGGVDLRFGNAEAMIETIGQIVNNTGKLGTVLSQGSARAAKVWGNGAEDCLITVKNEEAPAHMPQAKRSLALIYAVNPFGADHQSSEHDPMYEEGCSPFYLQRLALMGLNSPPPFGSLNDEKVRYAVLTQRFYSLMDTLELCQFVWGPAWCLYGPAETVELVRAVTGWDVSLEELMLVGERRLNLLKVYNVRDGFNRKDDVLPKKFFRPLKGTGPTAGVAIDPDQFSTALDTYYQMSGWTLDGIPTVEKLESLGLSWASKLIHN